MIKPKDLLFKLGIYSSLIGYQYLTYGISLILEDPSYLFSLTKRLYPAIGQHFGKKNAAIEAGIRNSIQHFWWFGNRSLFTRILGYTRTDPPSNGEFLSIIVDFLNSRRT